MGLRNDLQADIAEAFDDDLADAVTSFTYREVARTMDPNTNTSSEVTTDYASRGVFTNFRREDLKDSNVLPTDTQVIVLQNELATTPTIEGFVIDGTDYYTIIRVRQDPAKASWSLQCRQ